MASFEDLLVWQKAHQLVLQGYPLTLDFPDYERFAMADQLRRAVVSVATNIAEGYGSHSDGLFLRYLSTAQGSLAETRYLLLLARDLRYINIPQYDAAAALAEEVSKVASGFRSKVEERVRCAANR